ncbi:uncharacterized protein FTJAE_7448 [Fusarium tjaetaba]|uniref:Actin-like ATPase domain-containing protein n=1 Tax=Fusarium tjaetaba TaxID=1567544 RepID=A0A8H5RGD1_9HYPO|nr:uncharacterized protein FTJAE_7448 [Fusarium tjaetaba]KAF5632565.1 hypothetical protein FTJAE_7448 [Fusarium tjaetaba]
MDSSSGSRTPVVVGLDLGTTVLHPNNVEDADINIEWFKLGLPHPDDLPSGIRNSPKFKELNFTRAAADVTAKDATARFINNIWKVFLDDLRKKIPYPSIQISATVPMLWPEDACRAMYEALHQAEILNENVVLAPKFLAEPEAAALAFFSDSHYFEETNISKLNPGQTVLICDCGGGTVDTVAYEITSIHPFRVKEIRPGQCIFAGACLLDDGFMELLKEKVETMISPRAFQALTKNQLYEITSNRWEFDIKGRFGDNFPTQHIYLPIKWASSRQRRMRVGEGEEVTFTHDDLASIFDPVVGKITHLIEEEMLGISAKLSKDVTHLVVAGGFGQNDYLRKRVAETVARVSPTTSILSYPPGHGWNAVSMGAVAHALQAQAMQQPVIVASRIARSGWGVSVDRRNSIFWLVGENESLGATQPNLRLIPPEALSPDDRAGRDGFSIRVYSRQLQGEAPRTREVCILSWKTRDVGLNSDMKPILKADLQIGFKWDGAAMDFSLFYGGVEQSSVEVKHPWDA